MSYYFYCDCIPPGHLWSCKPYLINVVISWDSIRNRHWSRNGMLIYKCDLSNNAITSDYEDQILDTFLNSIDQTMWHVLAGI